MFSAHRTAASSCQNLEVETGVSHADPHRLIATRVRGAIAAIGRARGAEDADLVRVAELLRRLSDGWQGIDGQIPTRDAAKAAAA